jgi:murein DD-endopeptidase MepM/ murein hydrolase activator NlpD
MALCGLLAGCAEIPTQEAGSYVVKPQDTLYSIAWRHGLNYQDIARWNHIGADYRIVVGQTLLLHGTPGPGSAPPKSAVGIAVPRARNLKWLWPTEHGSAPQSVPGGGILISGRLGQDVRAACAGRVVYVGDGIRGYGNLIIVQHGEDLLSAYAHNRDVQVHESEEVSAGQVIGHMGEGSPGKPVLYFEIRRAGKPVDVLPFLSGAN